MLSESERNECIEGGQPNCAQCRAPLCIRKQVVNLALGNVDSMFCLTCLGKDSERSAEDVLINIKGYVLSRPCFKKEWIKYPDVSACPQPVSCFAEACFADDQSDYD